MILKGENKACLTAGNSILLKGLVVEGTKPRTQVKNIGKNSTVAIDAPIIEVETVDAKEVTCYNLFEQPYSIGSKKIKKVTITGLKSGADISHNIVNLYNFANDAKVIFKDCDFTLSKSSNAVRFDNIGEAGGVDILFENCNWTYEGSGYEEGDLEWMALVLFQTGTASQQGNPIMGKEYGWTLTIKNCKYNGEYLNTPKILASENTMEEPTAIFYMYDPKITEFTDEFLPNINIL